MRNRKRTRPYSTTDAAKEIGVSQSKLSQWLKTKGWLVEDKYHGKWEPSPNLPSGSFVIGESPFIEKVFRWSPEMVERMRKHIDEISKVVMPPKKKKGPPLPTPYQIDLHNSLADKLKLDVPMPATRREASESIGFLIEECKKINIAGYIDRALEREVHNQIQSEKESGKNDKSEGMPFIHSKASRN